MFRLISLCRLYYLFFGSETFFILFKPSALQTSETLKPPTPTSSTAIYSYRLYPSYDGFLDRRDRGNRRNSLRPCWPWFMADKPSRGQARSRPCHRRYTADTQPIARLIIGPTTALFGPTSGSVLPRTGLLVTASGENDECCEMNG